MTQLNTFESVAVSTRIRLARNFKDHPFPARPLKDKHAEAPAHEIVRPTAPPPLPQRHVRKRRAHTTTQDGEQAWTGILFLTLCASPPCPR